MIENRVTDIHSAFADPGTGTDYYTPNSAVHKAALAAGLSQYVQGGLELTPDWTNGELTISDGVAVLDLTGSLAAQSEPNGDYDRQWPAGVATPIVIPETTGLALEADAVNEVWVSIENANSKWEAVYHVGTGTPPSSGLKIGEVDTAAQTTSTAGRVPDISGWEGELADPQEPKEHGNQAHIEDFVTQSAVDAKADDPHGDAAHSENYAKSADLDTKADDPHDNAAHSVDFATPDDLSVKADDPHANEAHSTDFATPSDLDAKADDPHDNTAHSEDYITQTTLDDHTSDTANPHNVAVSDVSPADANFDLNGFNLLDGTGPVTVDGNANILSGELSEQGDRVATRNWTNNNADVPTAGHSDSAYNADKLDGLDREEFARRTRTYTIDSASGTEYYKIARISDGGTFEQGRFSATLYFATDNGNEQTRRVEVFGAVRSSGYDLKATQYGTGGSDHVDMLVTETDGTGTDGNNEYYLYVRADDFCKSEIDIKHNGDPNFDFQSGLSQADLNGAVVADTANPSADAWFGEVYDGGERVATRTWAANNNIDHADLGATGADDHHNQNHDNSDHTTNYTPQSDHDSHTSDTSNPHNVTNNQVGVTSATNASGNYEITIDGDTYEFVPE